MAANIFLVIMGLALCIITVYHKAKNNHLVKHGVRAEGEIVDAGTSGIKNDSNKYPLVRFLDKEGREVTLQSKEGFLSQRIKKGKKVTIFYDPAQPTEFMLRFQHDMTTFTIIIVMAALFTLAGLLLLFNDLHIIHLFKK
ncbi:MAG TPA: DUF3592 domain-containing protein [Chitinophagaceae bacterium]|jgi:hypothetical protein